MQGINLSNYDLYYRVGDQIKLRPQPPDRYSVGSTVKILFRCEDGALWELGEFRVTQVGPRISYGVITKILADPMPYNPYT